MSNSMWFFPPSSGTLDLLAEQDRPCFPPGWLREVAPVELTGLCPRLSDQGTAGAGFTLKDAVMPSLHGFLWVE